MSSFGAPEHVRRIQPYSGGPPVEQLARLPGVVRICQLASNENTAGPSPRVIAGLAREGTGLGFYPDGGGTELRRRLADLRGVDPSQVTLGQGSGEVIDLICRAFLAPGDRVVVSGLHFIQYSLSTRLQQGQLIEAPVRADLSDDPESFARAAAGARVVFLANPNNPTGTYLTAEQLARYFDLVGDDVLTVVDQAYQEYVDRPDYPDAVRTLRAGRNVMVLGTFSKAYGLAGLRIGYALGPQALIEDLDRVRAPFNTSVLGQRAALLALDDPEWVLASRERNRREMDRLVAELERRGVRVTPSVANFVLAHVGLPAKELAAGLEQRGVLVRALGFPALRESLRITVGLPEENDQLLAALAELGLPARG
ncbi:MAG TPA: histidinol-phosphate transaminase [Thermoanaerobaculia bacterium]|nr:histidinol-phosphate transaminase [Thermoanaerobaculia bacterium]